MHKNFSYLKKILLTRFRFEKQISMHILMNFFYTKFVKDGMTIQSSFAIRVKGTGICSVKDSHPLLFRN